MISRERLAMIAASSQGSLREVPFAVLLHALAVEHRTALLAIERPPLRKEIVIEDGVPVDCRSNLVHETLGRFMVARGALDDAGLAAALEISAKDDVPVGEVLLAKNIVSAAELERILQQNLAKKLLDGFSWDSGGFRLETDPPPAASPLKVNVPQLIVLGVTRFASQERVDAAVGPLVGKRLVRHPEPFYDLDEVRFSERHRAVLTALTQPRRMDELVRATGVAPTELNRLVFALATIGAVAVADGTAASRPAAPPSPAEPAVPAQRPAPIGSDELTRAFLDHRRRDPFDLLGVDESAGPTQLQAAFLAQAERFAPWQQPAELEEKARAVFVTLARAYAELMHPESRTRALADRRARREERSERRREPDRDRFRVKTDLLDPAVQFGEGRRLMEAGELQRAVALLEYAADLDPQNGEYRAEAAWCRYRIEPVTGARQAAGALEDAVRVDPRCGLAVFYLGQVLRQIGRRDEAEEHLKRAIRMMAPDRRPIDALKELAAERR